MGACSEYLNHFNHLWSSKCVLFSFYSPNSKKCSLTTKTMGENRSRIKIKKIRIEKMKGQDIFCGKYTLKNLLQ